MSNFKEIVELFISKYPTHAGADQLRVLRTLAPSDVFDEFAVFGLGEAIAKELRNRDLRPSRAEYQRERRREKEADVGYCKQHGIPLEEATQHQNKARMKGLSDLWNEEAARRAIRLLDLWVVGQKPLGKCTAADLKRASAEGRVEATTINRNCDLYDRIASVLPPNTTVEACNEREKILEILHDMLPEE